MIPGNRMWMSLVSGLIGSVGYAAADDAVNEHHQPDTPDQQPRVPDFDGQIPTPQQLLEVLDSMTGLSDEEKAKLKEDLLRNVQETANAAQAGFGSDFTTQTIVLLSLLALVALIFVFFIYKLFRLLSEREQKREEKKRSKQLKKKK